MAVTKGAEKWKVKQWFNIYPPEILGTNIIGEMPADDEKRVLGRIIKASMSWITSRMEHSFMVVGLKVVSVNGSSAHTEIKYLEQTYSYLHSLVKRHSSAIYTMDRLKDKNSKPFTLKLLVVTRSKIASPKKKAIRGGISKVAAEYAVGKTGSEFIKDSIEGTFQNECVKRITNIAEVAKLEIKKIEL